MLGMHTRERLFYILCSDNLLLNCKTVPDAHTTSPGGYFECEDTN